MQVVDGVEEVAERRLVGHVVGVGTRVGQGLGVGTGHLLDGVHRGFPAGRGQGGDEVLDPGLLGGAHHHRLRAPVAPDAGGVQQHPQVGPLQRVEDGGAQRDARSGGHPRLELRLDVVDQPSAPVGSATTTLSAPPSKVNGTWAWRSRRSSSSTESGNQPDRS